MGPAAWSASPARKQAVQQAVDTGPGRGQQCQLRVPSPAAAATRHLHAPCLMDPHRTLRRGDGRSEPICPGHSVDKGSNMTVGFGEADSHRNPVSGDSLHAAERVSRAPGTGQPRAARPSTEHPARHPRPRRTPPAQPVGLARRWGGRPQLTMRILPPPFPE